jgi:hypothetical protein
MNSLSVKKIVTRFTLAIFSMMMTIVTFAQDATKKVDVDISTDKGGDGFFASPWVWIIGIAVFILLLVALMRPSRRSDV